jgi:hypothetical protein
MGKKIEKKNAEKGKEKALNGRYGYDPMCGPIRP